MKKQTFESVWDALEDDPVKRELYKLRSELIHVVVSYLEDHDLNPNVTKVLEC